MKLGCLAYSSNNGLGIQSQALVEHLKPAKVMQVDLSGLNGSKQYPERLPNSQIVKGYPRGEDIKIFLKGLDCVLVAETPLSYYLFARARELGIKTAQIPNWEFLDYFAYPQFPKPDMIISPSKWHFDELQTFSQANNIKCIYLHHPVDRQKLPQRVIKQARTFLHVVGKSAAHDRNGTETVIQASKYLKTDAKILIHFQGEQGLSHQATNSYADYVALLANTGVTNITIQQNEFDNYWDVYTDGDVLLMPRRYGGNCLPMNEALSVGMPVIMTDISPNNQFLPRNWLVPATKISEFTPRTVIDIYGSDPEVIANKIDEFYNMNESQMWFENIQAGKLANSISWQSMKPQYITALEGLCR